MCFTAHAAADCRDVQLSAVPGRPEHGPEPVQEAVVGEATKLAWPAEAATWVSRTRVKRLSVSVVS